MILTDEQAIKLIQSPRPKFIQEAEAKHNVLKAHVTGKGYVDYLNHVSEYENVKQKEARHKFAKSIKDVMANILRPVDKIFSAKGSSIQFDATDTVISDLTNRLSKFDGDYGVKNWIKNVQKRKYFYDPSGFVFFEWGIDLLKPKLYSISDVYCYKVNGRGLDYVVFQPYYKTANDGTADKTKLYYRVVDSQSDRIFVKVGNNVRLIEDEVYENPWGYVPAVLNSNIPSDCGNYMDSPLEVISELASKYLRNDSIKSIYEFLHGYPIFWMYASQEPCKVCDGKSYVNDSNGIDELSECKACHGTGYSFKKDVTTAFFIKPPQEKDEPTIAPNIAGYVQPDLETWREQRTELEWLYDAMHFAVWGTTQSTRAKNETATARFLDLQPVNDRLYDFSESFEDMHKRLLKMYTAYYYKEAVKSITVIYGKRFIMESPDAIWMKYENARKNGAPEFTKNHLLEQYYQSEYEHDPEMMAYAMKGIQVEPFVHLTVDELNKAGLPVNDKAYFAEWWSSLQILDVLKKTPVDLKNDYQVFLLTKIINNE